MRKGNCKESGAMTTKAICMNMHSTCKFSWIEHSYYSGTHVLLAVTSVGVWRITYVQGQSKNSITASCSHRAHSSADGPVQSLDFGSSDFGSSDFGSSDFGSPDFADFGSSDFGSSDFGSAECPSCSTCSKRVAGCAALPEAPPDGLVLGLLLLDAGCAALLETLCDLSIQR